TALGVTPSTLRRWLAAGAPCERRGESGRNRGALVDIAELERWRRREGTADELMRRVLVAALDFHGARRHRLVGLTDAEAAALYHDLLAHIAARLQVDLPSVEMAALETAVRVDKPRGPCAV
ncbi:MAG: hypothetical protein ACM3W7_05545, partial [Acidobacteriota bacterium]